MTHPELSKVADNPKVRAALRHLRQVTADWYRRGDATGYKAGQTPIHYAEQELNAIVESLIYCR